MIEIVEPVTISASATEVWQLLAQPERVVACVPGAQLVELDDGGAFSGTLTTSFGPLHVAFSGKGSFELDGQSRSGRITARGRDGQGGTKFQTEANFRVVGRPDEASSVLELLATVTLAGRLAPMIEASATTVVRQMVADFGSNVAAQCASDIAGPAKDAEARNSLRGRVILKALLAGVWQRLRRLFTGREAKPGMDSSSATEWSEGPPHSVPRVEAVQR